MLQDPLMYENALLEVWALSNIAVCLSVRLPLTVLYAVWQ